MQPNQNSDVVRTHARTVINSADHVLSIIDDRLRRHEREERIVIIGIMITVVVIVAAIGLLL